MLARKYIEGRYKSSKGRRESEYTEDLDATAELDFKKEKLIADMLTRVLLSLLLHCDDSEHSNTGPSM